MICFCFKAYGPYIGFVKLEQVEGAHFWNYILIEDNSGKDKILKLCTQNELAGKCEQLLIKKYKVRSYLFF